MAKENGIAYHGTSVEPEKLKELGGILPRVGWQKPALAKNVAALPSELQDHIYAYVGPVLRGDPQKKTGQGDADPNLSVSLTWSPRVACFFPPKHRKTYIYVVDMRHTPWHDVDQFARTVGVERSYMQEIAVSNIRWSLIAGYFQIERFFAPRKIEDVACHVMEVTVGSYVELVHNSAMGSLFKKEIQGIPKGKFGLSATGIGGTFQTDENIRRKGFVKGEIN